MDPDLSSMLDRADELLVQLEQECTLCLKSEEVSRRARNIAHEVLDKLRSSLDQAMRRAWDKQMAPHLSQDERRKARVYFPVSSDLHSFESTLGRACMTELATSNPGLYQFLLDKQPFTAEDNEWLRVLSDLAAEGKHERLVPQKRMETRRITLTGPQGGSMSWPSSAVKFGAGVSFAGAPIDPVTQRIVPTPGVTERIEILVAFIIEGYRVNAIGFCRNACSRTSQLLEEMAEWL